MDSPSKPGTRTGIPNRSSTRQRELFKPYVQEAINLLAECIRASKDMKAGDLVSKFDLPTWAERISAAKIVIEYGLGKATQPIEGGGEDGKHVVLVKYV